MLRLLITGTDYDSFICYKLLIIKIEMENNPSDVPIHTESGANENFLVLTHPEFDRLSETDKINWLQSVNTNLKRINESLWLSLKNCRIEKSNLIEAYKSKTISDHLLVEQNEELKRNFKLRQVENKRLQEENSMLRAILTALETRLSLLEARNNPITIRDAMRILERCICYKAVGSRKKFRDGRYSFSAIEKKGEKEYIDNLERIKSEYGITARHMDKINYFKECGDYSAHSNRPHLTKKEWEALLQDEDEDEDESAIDEETPQSHIGTDLLAALANFFPISNENEPWVIEGEPWEKKNIVLMVKSVT